MCIGDECDLVNDTATTEIYTRSLHDALPISWDWGSSRTRDAPRGGCAASPLGFLGLVAPGLAQARFDWPDWPGGAGWRRRGRSEEHTSELQSRQYLVCCLLLEKKYTYLPHLI